MFKDCDKMRDEVLVIKRVMKSYLFLCKYVSRVTGSDYNYH